MKTDNLTGNSVEVLQNLFEETEFDVMGKDAMNSLVEEYTGSPRFNDRLKNMYVIRWVPSSDGAGNLIPFGDLLRDFAEIGLISEKVLADSLIVRKYEQAIVADTTIKQAQLEMAAELCVEMSIEDAIFNGIKTTQGEKV